MKRQRNPGIGCCPGSRAVPGFHFVPSGLQDGDGPTSTKHSRGAICARVLPTKAKPVARMSVSEIRGPAFKLASRSRISRSLSSGPAASGRTRWFHPGHERKGGGTPADAYLQPPHPQPSSSPACGGGQRRGRGARPAGRARLSAFHRGSCLGDPTPPLSSGYALPGTQPRRVLPALSLSQSSELLADRS